MLLMRGPINGFEASANAALSPQVKQ